MLLICLVIAATLTMACSARSEPALFRLIEWVTGSFSSQEQAAKDSSYSDILLHVAPVWPEISSGHWFYVEQTTAANPETPRRQRVYFVQQLNDTTFTCRVFSMLQPRRFAGRWQQEQPLAGLTPDSLKENHGCALTLYAKGDSAFVGGSDGTGCVSELRGTTYVTSEIKITNDSIVSWDRYYEAGGKQIWGATKGGYVLKKIAAARKPAR